MEAELVRELPDGDGWQYEPKWDGFRGVLENLDGKFNLWSRNERSLLRYFPELRGLGSMLPPSSALDGEIVIERHGALEFDALQMRLHPAESRINRLAGEIPARFVAFDVLFWAGIPLHELLLDERRARLDQLPLDRSPASRDRSVALDWHERLEAAGFDGIVAKRLDQAYLPGSRDGVVKIKRHRTAECVVVGVRWSEPGVVATLLLGLYDECGELHHVGLGGSVRGVETRRDRGERRSIALRRAEHRADRAAQSLAESEEGAGLVARTARGGRRGSLRQVAGHAVSARHEADALPARQEAGRLHDRSGHPAPARGRSDRRLSALS